MYHFVQYDKKTGEITSYFRSSTREFLPKPASLQHENVEVTEPEHIEFISSLNPRTARLHGRVESGKVKTLKPALMPALQLKCAKAELLGDGQDKTVIEVQAVDLNGKPVRNVEETVKITTERGKLSERGGLLKLLHGHAEIELTAANETVHKLRVRAVSLTGSCTPGEIVLEFL